MYSRTLSDKDKRSKLYRSVRRDAERKFKVYPSRYANIWLSQEYRRRKNKSRSRRSSRRTLQSGGTRGTRKLKIPDAVRRTAQRGNELRKKGFKGGTETGWKRGRQLANKESISEHDARIMRAWFARHSVTSKPSYDEWIKAGKPEDDGYFKRKGGIVAWLIWGGNAGQRWINGLDLA